MGIGGAPEGVITAAALRCLGGEIQARFRYRNDDERERGARMGHGDEDRVYRTEDLAPGENLVFAATGVTAGRPAPGRPLLRRRRADALAGDGLPDQAGPLRRHGPHVRPGQPAAGPALGRSSALRLQGIGRAVPAAAICWTWRSPRSGPASTSVWTSDHFQPWRHTDGHAPNALVWLGAATQATERVTLGTSVLTPSFRYNPAIVAQAIATLGCLAPGRVILGVGTGESLNEIPVGIEWPEQSERFARLQGVGDADPASSSARTSSRSRASTTGPTTRRSTTGPTSPCRSTSRRRGRPRRGSPGGSRDGLICTSGKGAELYTETLLPAVDEGAAKAGRDATKLERMIEMKVSFDTDRARAMEDTKVWSALALSGEQKVGVEDPREMERLAKTVEDVAYRRWLVSSDPDEHVEQIATYVDYGFDHLVFHFPGDDQEAAIARYEELILPRLRARFG